MAQAALIVAILALLVAGVAFAYSREMKKIAPIAEPELKVAAPVEPVRDPTPVRKRPGVASLRHKAEIESMQSATKSDAIVARNTRALGGA